MAKAVIIKISLIAIGTVILIFFFHLTGETLLFLKRTVQTGGRVHEIVLSDHEKEQYKTVIVFVAPSGERVFFSPDTSSSRSSYRVGQEVAVIYDPDFPEDAKIKSFVDLWLGPIALFIIAGFILLLGFCMPVKEATVGEDTSISQPDKKLLTFTDKLMFFLLNRFFPGSFMVMGSICIIAGLWDMKKMISSYYWPIAKGIVQSSDVKTSGGYYYPEIKYVFQVKGKKYESSNFDLSNLESGDPLPSQKAVKRYPKGKEVTVYYNPENPDECVLEPGIGWSLLLFFAGGAAFLFFGWVVIVALRRGWIK